MESVRLNPDDDGDKGSSWSAECGSWDLRIIGGALDFYGSLREGKD